MNDANLYATMALSGLTGLGMVVAGGLAGWRGWLQLRTRELDARTRLDEPATGAGARIEIADLKERIRKLEAIAAGVDL